MKAFPLRLHSPPRRPLPPNAWPAPGGFRPGYCLSVPTRALCRWGLRLMAPCARASGRCQGHAAHSACLGFCTGGGRDQTCSAVLGRAGENPSQPAACRGGGGAQDRLGPCPRLPRLAGGAQPGWHLWAKVLTFFLERGWDFLKKCNSRGHTELWSEEVLKCVL